MPVINKYPELLTKRRPLLTIQSATKNMLKMMEKACEKDMLKPPLLLAVSILE